MLIFFASVGGATATPKTTLAPTTTSTSTTPVPFVCPDDGYYPTGNNVLETVCNQRVLVLSPSLYLKGVPCSSTFYNCTLGQYNEEVMFLSCASLQDQYVLQAAASLITFHRVQLYFSSVLEVWFSFQSTQAAHCQRTLPAHVWLTAHLTLRTYT